MLLITDAQRQQSRTCVQAWGFAQRIFDHSLQSIAHCWVRKQCLSALGVDRPVDSQLREALSVHGLEPCFCRVCLTGLRVLRVEEQAVDPDTRTQLSENQGRGAGRRS